MTHAQNPNLTPGAFFPALLEGSDRVALQLLGGSLSYRELGALAGALAARLEGHRCAAVWAEPTLHTCVAAVAALLAGVPIVPVNPKAGAFELDHLISDSRPDVVLADSRSELPPPLAARTRVSVDWHGSRSAPPVVDEPKGCLPAFVVYTSGTTGRPKGAILSRDAIRANLDALARAWDWTAADAVGHALPLFHVHGLILGVLGPLRRGGCARLLGRFDANSVVPALESGATMLFAVPTMYHRLGHHAAGDARLRDALRGARLLVSGSAPLAPSDFELIRELSGQSIVERYGMTETLIISSTRAGGVRVPGSVGAPLEGVRLRVVGEDGASVSPGSDAIGEVEVRSPSLLSGYLNNAVDLHDGWFRTGDMGQLTADGALKLVGRASTDIIKTGGFKVGAGEIELAIASHPAVAEVAVTGEPDDDLGQKVVAWIVPSGSSHPTGDELADHVARLVAPHKRPREVRYLASLPRNPLGKVLKRELGRAQ